MFTLRFHDDGTFDMALPWTRLEDIEKHTGRSLVVGVSTNARFNEALGAPRGARMVYFAGRIGAQRGLEFGVLEGRAETTLPEGAMRNTNAARTKTRR